MKYVNLTPHDINLPSRVIKKSGIIAQIKEIRGHIEKGLRTDNLSEVTGIPPAKKDTVYIISMPTLLALRAGGENRSDVYCPITRGEGVIKNEKGHIIQVPGLRTF